MIPKYPRVPNLNKNQITKLTNIVFLPKRDLKKNDVIFVFGSTHPACVEATYQAYKEGLGREIIISGGRSNAREKHKDWTGGDGSEASSISSQLIERGIPEDRIHVEEQATNSKENVILATKLFDFSKVKGVTIISKNYVVGRQYRTLMKYIPSRIQISSYGYNVYLDDGTTFDENNWTEKAQSRSLVFGEYLRIISYGERGDIVKNCDPIEGLERYSDFNQGIF